MQQRCKHVGCVIGLGYHFTFDIAQTIQFLFFFDGIGIPLWRTPNVETLRFQRNDEKLAFFQNFGATQLDAVLYAVNNVYDTHNHVFFGQKPTIRSINANTIFFQTNFWIKCVFSYRWFQRIWYIIHPSIISFAENRLLISFDGSISCSGGDMAMKIFHNSLRCLA